MKPNPRAHFRIDHSLSRLEMLQHWVNKYNTSQKPKKSQTKKRAYGYISQKEVKELQEQLEQMKF